MADRRNILIDHFCKWKGERYIPSAMHPAIRWSKTDPFLECQDSVSWRVIDSKMDTIKNRSMSASVLVPNVASETIPQAIMPGSESNGSTHVMSELKRKRIYVVSPYSPKGKQMSKNLKKVKFCIHATNLSAPIQIDVPLGTQWQNNSCAYDAIIIILFNMWYDSNPVSATISFEDTQCVMFNALIQSFHTHESGQQVESGNSASGSSTRTLSLNFSLEEIRDYFRRRLARSSPEFTFGSYTSVQSIAEYLFHAEDIVTTSNVLCPEGHSENDSHQHLAIR